LKIAINRPEGLVCGDFFFVLEVRDV